MKMNTFCSTWMEGKIDDINELINQNQNRNIAFVLDTNIVIYIREYYENPKDFEEKNPMIFDEFVSTISFLKEQESIYFQYGCEESCRDKKQGKLNKVKYRHTVNCLNVVLKKKFSKDILYSYEEYPIIEESKINILKSGSLFGIQSVVRYASLLKAFLIKKTCNSLNDEEKIYEFINFLDKDLNVTSPMDIAFSIYYFGNNSCILNKINMNQSMQKILDKIYAASIDLTIPTLTAQLSEFSYYSIAPIFVTFDKGIKLIYDSLYIVEEDTWNNTIIPKYGYIFYHESNWNDEDLKRITNNIEIILSKRRDDFKKNKRKVSDLNHYMKKCIEIENELKLKKALIT